MQRVSAEAGNAHALLLDGNVTLMFAEIAGSGMQIVDTLNILYMHICTHMTKSN